MHKDKRQVTNQDRHNFAVLSIVTLCLKFILPLITALLISHPSSAQPPLGSQYEDQQTLTQALQLICTPTGIILTEGSSESDPSPAVDHCSSCLIVSTIGIVVSSPYIGHPDLTQGSMAWQIADLDLNRKLIGYSHPASRAPPTA